MKPGMTNEIAVHSQRRTQTRRNAIAAISFAVAAFLLLPTASYSQTPQDCTVTFSDRYALLNVVGQSRDTFVATSTKKNGKLDWTSAGPSPSSAQTDLNRWMYKQPCNGNTLSVWDQVLRPLSPSLQGSDHCLSGQ